VEDEHKRKIGDGISSRRRENGDDVGFSTGAGEVSRVGGVARAQMASRGGEKGGRDLLAMRGGGTSVLRGGAATLGAKSAVARSPEKKNRGGT